MISEKEMIELQKRYKLANKDKIAVIKILLEDAYFEKYGEKPK